MKTYNEFNKDLNKVNVDKAIGHDWATHIHHPSLGEVKVESHSLTEKGEIEEYYVVVKGKEYTCLNLTGVNGGKLLIENEKHNYKVFNKKEAEGKVNHTENKSEQDHEQDHLNQIHKKI